MAYENFVQVLLDRVKEHPDRVCQRFHRDGAWRDWTYEEVLARARGVAGGLVARGVGIGDRVAIMSENSPEWVLADLGGMLAGAVVVSVYAGLVAEEAAYVVDHSESKVVFVENGSQAEKLVSVRESIPLVERIVVLDDSTIDDDLVEDFSEFTTSADPEATEARISESRSLPSSAPATLLYTSGTTGTPKGVMLSHRNLVGTVEASFEAHGYLEDVDVSMRILPLAHALERIAGHLVTLYRGAISTQVRSYETVAEDLRVLRPNYVPLVPRVLEKVRAAIFAKVEASPTWRRRVFRWALEVGTQRSRRLEREEALPVTLALRYAIADRLVFRKLRDGFGGRIVFFGCGGAPLSPEVARFFHAAGLLVCEAWGATETSAPATTNTRSAYRFGSIGRPLPGVEVKVAGDGELLVRGVNVFSGYYKDPEATAAAFDEDGFYRTGDVGHIDEDGFVYITDRKKELIITAAGKNIAPQKLENLLRASPYVANCLVHCDRRPFVVALLNVDRRALEASRPDLAGVPLDDERVRDVLSKEVAAANSKLARFEQIKYFRILEREFAPETGELTLTLKLKRRIIEENYRHLLDEMYEVADPAALRL